MVMRVLAIEFELVCQTLPRLAGFNRRVDTAVRMQKCLKVANPDP